MHDLDKVKASDDLKNKTLQAIIYRKTKKPHIIIVLPITLLFCLTILLAINLFSSNGIMPNDPKIESYSYVSIDINPSLELQLDKKDMVINIVTYNEDAMLLVNAVDMNGLNAQEAILRIINNENTAKYIKNGFLQISVYSENEKHSKNLEMAIQDSLSKTLEEAQYGCSSSSKYNYEEASLHHMSFGKYQVIDRILGIDNTYTIEELQNFNMLELKRIYENSSGESLSGKHHSTDENHNNKNGKHHH